MKVGSIRLDSHRLFKQNPEVLTHLGSQFSTIFEPLPEEPDFHRPKVVCTTCKIYITKASSGEVPKKRPIQFNWPNYSHQTRSICTPSSKCPMCEEATRFGRRSLGKSEISHQKPGRPLMNSPPKVVKRCSKCMSEMSQGLTHQCNRKSLIENTHLQLEHMNALDRYASHDILQRLDESDNSTSSLQLPRPDGGYPLTVNVATSSHCQPESESKKPRIDLEKMMQLKSTGEMSNNQFKKVSTVLRDSGVRCPSIGDFYEKKKEFSLDLMECTQISLDHSKEKYNSDIKERFVVRCSIGGARGCKGVQLHPLVSPLHPMFHP